MNILSYIKDKFPFELKRGTSIASIVIALIFTGAFTRLGEIILEKLLSYLKPYLPRFWDTLIWLTSISFEINLVGAIIFVIILFPIYRMLDKFLLQRSGGELIFKDDFDTGNKGWTLNYWGSNNPAKTNRIDNSTMIFEASDSDLPNHKEFGAFFDLKNGVYQGNTYEVSCKVRSEKQTTMQFKLWLHDTVGGISNIVTPLRTPHNTFEIIKLNFTANQTEAIRIHLHNKAGDGKILVDEVVVRKI